MGDAPYALQNGFTSSSCLKLGHNSRWRLRGKKILHFPPHPIASLSSLSIFHGELRDCVKVIHFWIFSPRLKSLAWLPNVLLLLIALVLMSVRDVQDIFPRTFSNCVNVGSPQLSHPVEEVAFLFVLQKENVKKNTYRAEIQQHHNLVVSVEVIFGFYRGDNTEMRGDLFIFLIACTHCSVVLWRLYPSHPRRLHQWLVRKTQPELVKWYSLILFGGANDGC